MTTMHFNRLLRAAFLLILAVALLPGGAVAQEGMPPQKVDDSVLSLQAELEAKAAGSDGASEGSPSQVPMTPLAPAIVPPPPPACAPTTTTYTNNTAVPIPDSGGPVAVSQIVVAGAGTYLFDLDLTTFIVHTFNADLDFTLESPAGTIVTLSTDNGGGNDDVFNGTLWDDDANPGGQVPYSTNNGLVSDHAYVNNVTASPLVPEESFGAFIGEDPNGVWTLTIDDDAGGDVGTLNSWSLTVHTAGACPPPPPTAVGDTVVSYGWHIFVDVLANDLGGTPPYVVGSVSAANHGRVYNYVTAVLYVPDRGYKGPDSFTYTVRDAAGVISAPGIVNVTIY